MKRDKRFLTGLELFNREKFFECHEVIEGLWLETKGDSRDLYKGVIQAAVALYHLKRGNLRGARWLLRSSSRYLEKYKPRALGLNVEKLIREMRVCFKTVGDPRGKERRSLESAKIPKLDFHK